MTHLILPLLQVNVVEKLKVAPDSSYETGVLIGSFLPFVLLVGVAYWMYYRAKKGSEKE
ncbi:MAG: hypothetical protein PHC28_07960 [Flavobacterium sp.]|uniref:hypothetical protein n=1 Tax=Flavobacterium sp. TaxID=239 RepID=UPI0026393FE6|nr:hypothetical protein [Flavobacterium sp.]MDD5150406.1 hypothetical protein [Flavobacterium sp.]